MTRATFDVTFERWTDADSEAGDTDDRGWAARDVGLRDALDAVGDIRGVVVEPDSSPCLRPRWLTFYEVNDGTLEWYETGVRENRSLHIPETVTDATARRIAALCGADGFDEAPRGAEVQDND